MVSSSDRTLLSFDLVEEILSRIPIEYLIRFQLVCKGWYALLKNKRFIYRYSDLVQERFIRFDNMVQIIDPVAQTRIISPMPEEFGERPWIYELLHCDGLLLLKFNSRPLKDHCNKLVVWNPILGKIKWIKLRDNYGFNTTYGIGYSNVSRDEYKILRFYNPISEVKHKECYGVEIYDTKSNSWSTVDVSSDWSRDQSCEGISVNGNMYWMAHWVSDGKKFIQSFDFSSQTFKPRSCLPYENYIRDDDTIALSCFRRDRLCLLYQSEETRKIEVWVSNKVNEEVTSWSKYLCVATPDLPLLYTWNGFFIDKNDKIRVWCDEETVDETDVSVYEIGKDGIKREVETGRWSSNDGGYVYVPSLVSLPV